MKMKSYTGRLQELGDYVTNGTNNNLKSIVSYSYIQIGDTILKKVGTMTGLNGKLVQSLGDEVTLYVCKDYVVAIKTRDGRTYGTDFGDHLFLCLLFFGLSIPAMPFGIGFLTFWLTWIGVFRGYRFQLQVKSLPGVIMI